MPLRRSRLLFCGAVALAAAACSDNPAGPSTPKTPDLTTLLAEMAPSGLGGATAYASPTLGLVATSTPSIDPDGCAYHSDTGFFVCPTVTRNGLTFTREFRLIDGSGNSQSKADAQTSALELKATVEGTITPPASSALGLSGRSDMTLSGIQSDKHTLNGTSTATMTGTVDFEGTAEPVTSTFTQTITNLGLPSAKLGQRWPTSGTIAIDETTDVVTGSAGPQSVHLVMQFNGTSIVTVTITEGSVTTTCHFDMAKPGITAGSCS
jgi:hypothetical protein